MSANNIACEANSVSERKSVQRKEQNDSRLGSEAKRVVDPFQNHLFNIAKSSVDLNRTSTTEFGLPEHYGSRRAPQMVAILPPPPPPPPPIPHLPFQKPPSLDYSHQRHICSPLGLDTSESCSPLNKKRKLMIKKDPVNKNEDSTIFRGDANSAIDLEVISPMVLKHESNISGVDIQRCQHFSGGSMQETNGAGPAQPELLKTGKDIEFSAKVSTRHNSEKDQKLAEVCQAAPITSGAGPPISVKSNSTSQADEIQVGTKKCDDIKADERVEQDSVPTGSLGNLATAAYLLTEKENCGTSKVSVPEKSLTNGAKLKPTEYRCSYIERRKTAADSCGDHPNRSARQVPVLLTSQSPPQKSQHKPYRNVAKLQECLKRDKIAISYDTKDAFESTSNTKGCQKNVDKDTLVGASNHTSIQEKPDLIRQIHLEKAQEDLDLFEEEAGLVTIKVADGIELRKITGADGEVCISVHKRDEFKSCSRQYEDGQKESTELVPVPTPENEGCLLQINIRSAKLMTEKMVNRITVFEPCNSSQDLIIEQNDVFEPKVTRKLKRHRLRESTDGKPLSSDFRPQKRPKIPISNPDSIRCFKESGDQDVFLGAAAIMEMTGMAPGISATPSIKYTTQDTLLQVKGRGDAGKRNNNRESVRNDIDCNEVSTEGNVNSKKSSFDSVDNDVTRCDCHKIQGQEKREGIREKISSRRTYGKRRRDNWTDEDNNAFLAVVHANAGIGETALRKTLARKFAPRRTHEQCVNHLRILRATGRLPKTEGEATVSQMESAKSHGENGSLEED